MSKQPTCTDFGFAVYSRRKVEELMDLNDESNFIQSISKERRKNFELDAQKTYTKNEFKPWGTSKDNESSGKNLHERKTSNFIILKPQEVIERKLNTGKESSKIALNPNFVKRMSRVKKSINFFPDLRKSQDLKVPNGRSTQHSAAKSKMPDVLSIKAKSSYFLRSSVLVNKNQDLQPVTCDDQLQTNVSGKPFERRFRVTHDSKSLVRSNANKPLETSAERIDKNSKNNKVETATKIRNIELLVKKKEPEDSSLSLNRNPYFVGSIRRMILDSNPSSVSKNPGLKKIEPRRGIVVFPKKVSSPQKLKSLLLDNKFQCHVGQAIEGTVITRI